MQMRLSNWAPYIGALGAALIVAGIFMTLLFALPIAILLALVAVGIVLIAIYLFSRPRTELREAVTGRRTLYGSNSLVLSVAFIIVVVLINFIVTRQFPNRIDLTENQSQTLSSQTIQALKGLTSPVQVTGFFAATPEGQQAQVQAETELKKYTAVTDKLAIKYVDTQANPTVARDYGIVQDGTLVFEESGRRSQVNQPYDENSIANAILKVQQTKQSVIYFTTGHGEQDSKRQDSQLTFAVGDLQNLNYKVDTLNLATSATTSTVASGMPADISALVIAGPQQPFSAQEQAKVKSYLDSGGRVMLLVDPQIDPGLKDLLNAWGLDLNNDLVIDQVQNIGGYATIPVVQDFPTNPITSKLTGYYVFLPTVRSLKQTTGSDKTPEAMFETTAQACGITDFAALKNQQQQVRCATDKEEQGPLTLGYSVEFKGASASQAGRLVVIGNSQFAYNQWLQQSNNVGNLYLFRNSINWLAGQDELISVPSKQTTTRQTPDFTNQEQIFVWFSSVIMIPAVIFIIGLLIWWRRR